MNKPLVFSLSAIIVAGLAVGVFLISTLLSKSNVQQEIMIVDGRGTGFPLDQKDQHSSLPIIDNKSSAIAEIAETPVRTFYTSGHVVDEPKVEREARDDEWASVSETSIRNSLYDIPGINRGTLLVHCGATVCRAEGSVNGASSSPAIDKIQSGSFYEPSRSDNYILKRFMPTDSSSNSFIIEFARLHK